MNQNENKTMSAKVIKKSSRKPDFQTVFLNGRIIRNRKPTYISKEVYDKISSYLMYIGQGKASLISYVDNILLQIQGCDQ